MYNYINLHCDLFFTILSVFQRFNSLKKTCLEPEFANNTSEKYVWALVRGNGKESNTFIMLLALTLLFWLDIALLKIDFQNLFM